MQHITIIGSGTMGNGIAHVFAQYGYSVQLYDSRGTALDQALITIAGNLDRQIAKKLLTEENKTTILNRLTLAANLKQAVLSADLVIEAITEDISTKLDLFQELDEICPSHCLLASNTSSISITKLAAATQRPNKVIGMHFMNPVPLMPLVEIIRGHQTDTRTTEIIVNISKQLNKTPVVVKDYPGFIANRLLMPMINEAIYALYEGVAGIEEIDTIMKLGTAHPMGPLQLADFIGLDVCLAILNVLYEGFGNPKYAPCPLLVNMVNAKQLGKKSGGGFYSYSENPL